MVRLQRLHELAFILLGADAEQAAHIINLKDDKPSLPTVLHSQIEKKPRNLLAEEVFFNGIDRNLDDALVPVFASYDARCLGDGARTLYTVAGAGKDSQCRRESDIEATGDYFAQPFRDTVTRMERVGLQITLEIREDNRGAAESLIGDASTREIVVVSVRKERSCCQHWHRLEWLSQQ